MRRAFSCDAVIPFTCSTLSVEHVDQCLFPRIRITSASFFHFFCIQNQSFGSFSIFFVSPLSITPEFPCLVILRRVLPISLLFSCVGQDPITFRSVHYSRTVLYCTVQYSIFLCCIHFLFPKGPIPGIQLTVY